MALIFSRSHGRPNLPPVRIDAADEPAHHVSSDGPWQLTGLASFPTPHHVETVVWCRSCGAVDHRTMGSCCPSPSPIGADIDAALDGPCEKQGDRFVYAAVAPSRTLAAAMGGAGRPRSTHGRGKGSVKPEPAIRCLSTIAPPAVWPTRTRTTDAARADHGRVLVYRAGVLARDAARRAGHEARRHGRTMGSPLPLPPTADLWPGSVGADLLAADAYAYVVTPHPAALAALVDAGAARAAGIDAAAVAAPFVQPWVKGENEPVTFAHVDGAADRSAPVRGGGPLRTVRPPVSRLAAYVAARRHLVPAAPMVSPLAAAVAAAGQPIGRQRADGRRGQGTGAYVQPVALARAKVARRSRAAILAATVAARSDAALAADAADAAAGADAATVDAARAMVTAGAIG